MPAKLIRCVKAVKAKGVKNPWGICIASTGLKPHRSYSKRMVTKFGVGDIVKHKTGKWTGKVVKVRENYPGYPKDITAYDVDDSIGSWSEEELEKV